MTIQNKHEDDKIEHISRFIDKKLNTYKKPTVVILEVGHFHLPTKEENLKWARQNIVFADTLCKNIIKKHKSKFKIIPTLLINNLENNAKDKHKEIIDRLLKDLKYINHKSLKIISERNLKNRAFKSLKNDSKLVNSFINIDGKAYLKDDDYEHDLAAGFVNEDGQIIPRCGLILTSFLDKISTLAHQRLHQSRDINILFVSFSEQFFEYKRVMLGVDIYTKRHKDLSIDPMIFYTSYGLKDCQLSYKSGESKTWQKLEF